MTVQICYKGRVAVLSPCRPITTDHMEELHKGLTQSLDQGATALIIDLTEVTHFDSSGLRTILDWAVNLSRERRSLRLVNPNSVCSDVLCATRMESVVDVFATVEDAIRAGR